MWSHYTDSHKGYILHFQIYFAHHYNTPSIRKLGDLIPVRYRKKREEWNLRTYIDNKIEYTLNMIRFKSDSWSYENKLRIVNIDKYGFIETPANWLKTIVLGVNSKPDLLTELKRIGDDLNVPVLQALMDEKEYKIMIPGLGITGNEGKTSYNEYLDFFETEMKNIYSN